MALALLNPTRLNPSRFGSSRLRDQTIALDGELSIETPSSTLPLDRLCDLVAELTDTDREHAIDAVFEAQADVGRAEDPLDLVARALVKLRRGTAADRARLAEAPRYVPHGSLRRWERTKPAVD